MNIHTITPSSLAIYLSGEDLCNTPPSALDASQTANFVKSALRRLGKPDCINMYLEVFPGETDLLLFAQLETEQPVMYAFEDFESIISAAGLYRETPPSSLYFHREKYILVLYPWYATNTDLLAEYGERLDYPPAYRLHFSEHGSVLIEGNALEIIANNFG